MKEHKKKRTKTRRAPALLLTAVHFPLLVTWSITAARDSAEMAL